jgi:hypothetical protein
MGVMAKDWRAVKWIAKADAWLEQRAAVMVAAFALIGGAFGAIDTNARSPLARLLGMAFGGFVWGCMSWFWTRRVRTRAMNQPT